MKRVRIILNRNPKTKDEKGQTDDEALPRLKSSAVYESRENTQSKEPREQRWELLPYRYDCVIVEQVRRELRLYGFPL